jgi:acyl carrier protein
MAMTRDEIKEKVIDIVADQFPNHGREKMKETTAFVDDLGADSLDIAEIVMEFEDEFDINIPETEQGKQKTIGDAIASIEAKLNA